MIANVVWLLVAISGSYSSPNTLAVINDVNECRSAAATLHSLAKDRAGSANIYAYCVPISAKAVVK